MNYHIFNPVDYEGVPRHVASAGQTALRVQHQGRGRGDAFLRGTCIGAGRDAPTAAAGLSGRI